MTKIQDFLTDEEERAIIEAIRIAERNTSGEIRVHLEASLKNKDAYDRAGNVFDMLNMQNTRNRNGVLIYVAIEDRTLVILGDKGINDKVDPFFWESIKDTIITHFKNNDMKSGLVDGVLMAGEQLKKYFPAKKEDTNELPDDISIG